MVLDGIGAVLIGLGLAKYFGKVDVLPPNLVFKNYSVYFIITGAIMMLPAIIHIIDKVNSINRETRDRQQ